MKHFKEHHLYIPAVAILVLVAGSWVSAQGMQWYQTIQLPWYTPPTWAFPIAWNIIYFLTIISAIMYWDASKPGEGKDVKWLFALNALLNVSWTYLFFNQHMIGASLFVAVLLECTVVLLMLLMWPLSQRSVLLLIPYAAWVGFALCLNYGVWMLN